MSGKREANRPHKGLWELPQDGKSSCRRDEPERAGLQSGGGQNDLGGRALEMLPAHTSEKGSAAILRDEMAQSLSATLMPPSPGLDTAFSIGSFPSDTNPLPWKVGLRSCSPFSLLSVWTPGRTGSDTNLLTSASPASQTARCVPLPGGMIF